MHTIGPVDLDLGKALSDYTLQYYIHAWLGHHVQTLLIGIREYHHPSCFQGPCIRLKGYGALSNASYDVMQRVVLLELLPAFF